MAGLKWNTGKLYYSTVELGYQQCMLYVCILVCMYVVVLLEYYASMPFVLS